MPATAPTMTQAVQLIYAGIPTQDPPLPASLWFEEVPPDLPQLPIVQFKHQGEPPPGKAYTTNLAGGTFAPNHLIGKFQLVIWHTSIPQLEDWARAIMTAFNFYVQNNWPLDSPQVGSSIRTNYVIAPTGLVAQGTTTPVRTLTLDYQVFIGNPAA